VGVSQLVFDSISACDIDLRPLLFNNVIVTGGNTLFPGFTERLGNDLPMMVPGVSLINIYIYKIFELIV
jgi:actin-related protein